MKQAIDFHCQGEMSSWRTREMYKKLEKEKREKALTVVNEKCLSGTVEICVMTG